MTTPGSSGTFDTSSSSLTLAGQVSGNGGLNKTGTATLTLAGGNTYTGDTNVIQGAVVLANSNAAQNTTVNSSVDNGVQFAPDIGTFNVGSLGGSGNLVLADTGGGAVTVVTGGNNASTTYSGAISGAGTLVHNGTGNLLLTAANSYSGGTVLGPDDLGLANSFALGTGTVSFNGDATIYAATSSLTLQNPIVIGPGLSGSFNTAGFNMAISGSISGAGSLAKIGAGTLTLSGSNSFTGGLLVSSAPCNSPTPTPPPTAR